MGALQGRHVLHVCGKVLPGCRRGRYGLEVAEVVGLKGQVVAGGERSPRLDHFRNAACVRHRVASSTDRIFDTKIEKTVDFSLLVTIRYWSIGGDWW